MILMLQGETMSQLIIPKGFEDKKIVKLPPKIRELWSVVVHLGVTSDLPAYAVSINVNSKQEKFMQSLMPIQLEWMRMLGKVLTYRLANLLEEIFSKSSVEIELLYLDIINKEKENKRS
jgi:hypothetical protein